MLIYYSPHLILTKAKLGTSAVIPYFMSDSRFDQS